MSNVKIIWRFIDEKDGHDKQSLALATKIKEQAKCKIFNIKVQSLRNPFLKIIFKNYNLGKNLPIPDIAIGVGHKTHLHLLAVKRSFGTKVIVIMKPSLPLKFFDLCVIPKHDEIKSRPNIFTTQYALVNLNTKNKKKENLGLFLVGGPSKHYDWDTKLVLQKIKKISKQSKLKKLLLTTSRRTPENFVREFNNLNLQNVKVYEYFKIEKDWLDKNINIVKNIWVTNDSYSMIIEALSSGAYVDILELKKKRNSKLSKEISLIKNNMRKKIPIQDEALRIVNFIKKKWL